MMEALLAAGNKIEFLNFQLESAVGLWPVALPRTPSLFSPLLSFCLHVLVLDFLPSFLHCVCFPFSLLPSVPSLLLL